MHITLILYGILSGICLYVGFVNATDARRTKQDQRLSLFALYSITAGIYGIALETRYQLDSVAEISIALKFEITFIALMFMVFPWFVKTITSTGSRRWLIASNILVIVFILINLLSPYSLQFGTQPTVKAIELAWGEIIWLPRGSVGTGFVAGAVLILLLQIYALYAFSRFYRQTLSVFSRQMLFAVILTFAASIHEIFVRLSALDTIHVGSFGILSMVLVMNMALSRENQREKTLLQQDLHLAQKLQKAIVNYAGYAIISGTPEGIITSYNPAAERMLGYTAKEMVGKQTPNVFHDPAQVEARAREFSLQLGETIEPGFEVFVAKARRGLPNEHEWTFIRKDGTRFPVLLTVTALRNDANEIDGFLGIAIDISERNLALHALRESEEKYRLLFENMTTAFALHEIICDDDGKPVNYRYLEINPAFEKLTGVPASALMGKTILEVLPNTEQYWIDVFGKVALTGQPTAYENFSRELGRYYDTWVFSPRKNQFAVIFSDSTERIRAAEALRTRETQLRSTLDNTPGVAVQWFDRTGRVIYWNVASEKLYAIPAAEAIGETMQSLLDMPKQSKRFIDYIGKIETEKTSVGPYEIKINSKNGAEVTILYTLFMIPGADEEPIFVCMAVDITGRKRAEAELRLHREHLEELVEERTHAVAMANQELEAFSYSVSHDLRAPLRSIDGFSQILAEDYASALDTAGLGYLERIRKSSQRMSILIDDLLQLARIGRAVFSPKEVDMSALAREIINQLQHNDPERKVKFDVEPEVISRGDPQLVHLVLMNLLDNAWKYTRTTDNAHIEFGQQKNNNVTIYFVRDNGVGFDMQYVDKLFGAFQRLHSMEEFPGTGIGLATVQRIVKRHEGRVWAQAEPNQGATFFFTLTPEPE